MRTVPATPRTTHRAAQHSPAMEQQLEQLQLAEQQEQRDWASLPDDVLRLCLSAAPLRGDKPSCLAAFRTCKAFARALLHTSLQGLVWGLDQSQSLVPSAQLVEALWGREQHEDQGVRGLKLTSAINAGPERCVAALLNAHVRLPCIRHLVLEGLPLDVLIPSGISVLLPNLEKMAINQCRLTPAAKATVLDAACSKLRHMQIQNLSAEPPGAAAASSVALATAQLKQLAKFPGFSCFLLNDSTCPTLFLLALGTQLTRLDLHSSYQQYQSNTLTPTPGWKATLQHVARCTRLQELTIPCITAEDLGLVAPALQQLRTLRLNTSDSGIAAAKGADGDAMMEVLLGLPHLTSLRWDTCVACTFQRRYAASQQHRCRWEELTMDLVSVRNLARLPLHSLKRPVLWNSMMVYEGTTRQEVRAAVANVTRNCPAGFEWGRGQDAVPGLVFAGNHVKQSVADALVALQPLLMPLAGLQVSCYVWDVRLVKVLGQVLPRTCTWLRLISGSVSRQVLEQVASSMSWVATLQLRHAHVLPQDVVHFVRTVRSSTRGEGAVAQSALGTVKVTKLVRPEGMGEVRHKREWEEAVREVQRVSKGAVVMSVEW